RPRSHPVRAPTLARAPTLTMPRRTATGRSALELSSWSHPRASKHSVNRKSGRLATRRAAHSWRSGGRTAMCVSRRSARFRSLDAGDRQRAARRAWPSARRRGEARDRPRRFCVLVRARIAYARAVFFRVQHESLYRYDVPVQLGAHTLRLTPRGAGARLIEREPSIEPAPLEQLDDSDAFGNPITRVRFGGDTQALRITSRFALDTAPEPALYPLGERLPLAPAREPELAPYLS